MTKFRNLGAIRAGRALALVAGAGLLVSCASVEQTSQTMSSDTGHSRAAYAPNVEAMAVEAYAALGRANETPPTINIAETVRASIGGASFPAASAHEAALGASEGLAADAHAAPVKIYSPSKTLIQNDVANGGWREEDGKYVHAYSGLVCEPSLLVVSVLAMSDMKLQSIYVFDETGYDVGCHYVDTQSQLYFTLYASKWPDVTLDQHFMGAVRDIVKNNPVASESSFIITETEQEEDVASTIEGTTIGAAFYLKSDSKDRAFKTVLWLNKTGPWHVKARSTFPVEMSGGRESSLPMAELMTGIAYSVALNMVDSHINRAGVQSVNYRR